MWWKKCKTQRKKLNKVLDENINSSSMLEDIGKKVRQIKQKYHVEEPLISLS